MPLLLEDPALLISETLTTTNSHHYIVRHREDFAAVLRSADSDCESYSLFRLFVEHGLVMQKGGIQIAAPDCTYTGSHTGTHSKPN